MVKSASLTAIRFQMSHYRSPRPERTMQWLRLRMDSRRRWRDNKKMLARNFGRQTSRFLIFFLAASFCLSCEVSLAQSSDSQTAPQSWTDTKDLNSNGANPTRMVESHSQSGNRTIDHQSTQRLGADGNYEPYQDIEKETVKVDANTVRTVTRTYGRDADGAKTLLQVTEEEQRTRAGGGSSTVRSTSNPDADGRLQLVQREMKETTKLSKTEEQTKTTVMLPGPNGGLAPAMQTQERSTQTAPGTIASQKTTLLPDGNGNWQVSEVRQTTTEQQGTNSKTEEKVSRPDADGRLTEISRKVSDESTSGGETKKTEEDYSLDVPGRPQDGGLHLVKRATTAQTTSGTGKQNVTQIEQRNPADPGAGLQVTVVTSGGVQAGPSGARSTQTLQQLDANGDLSVVSVDTTKSSNNHAVQVQIAPSAPPKQ